MHFGDYTDCPQNCVYNNHSTLLSSSIASSSRLKGLQLAVLGPMSQLWPLVRPDPVEGSNYLEYAMPVSDRSTGHNLLVVSFLRQKVISHISIKKHN